MLQAERRIGVPQRVQRPQVAVGVSLDTFFVPCAK
jgi:hypothetical protein